MNLSEFKQMPWPDAVQYLKDTHDACEEWIDHLRTYTSVDDFLQRASAEDRSGSALWWGEHHPEDRASVRPLVTSSWDAYWWALEFPEDREFMRPVVRQASVACLWAKKFPEDKEIMRFLITNQKSLRLWIKKFPEDTGYFEQKGLL